jgi:hypothetical protein
LAASTRRKRSSTRFKAGKIDADVHEMALQHLRADNAQRRAEQGESDKAMIGQVWDLARKGGSITDLSPSQLAYVKQRGLGVHIDQMFKRADEATSTTASSTATSCACRPRTRPLREDGPVHVVGSLTKAHWNHLVGMQTSINRGDVKALDQRRSMHDAVQDARAQLLAAGHQPEPQAEHRRGQAARPVPGVLYDALTTAQPDWQDKKLTRAQMRDEARKLTLGMLKDQALSGSGLLRHQRGPDAHAGVEDDAEQRAAPWDIPQAERQQIVQALQKRGMPVTEDAVQRAYKLAQGVR